MVQAEGRQLKIDLRKVALIRQSLNSTPLSFKIAGTNSAFCVKSSCDHQDCAGILNPGF